MQGNDFLFLLFGIPTAIVIGAWLGRIYQRWRWHLDKPYAERIHLLKLGQ